jgi:hypothetical protein
MDIKTFKLAIVSVNRRTQALGADGRPRDPFLSVHALRVDAEGKPVKGAELSFTVPKSAGLTDILLGTDVFARTASGNIMSIDGTNGLIALKSREPIVVEARLPIIKDEGGEDVPDEDIIGEDKPYDATKRDADGNIVRDMDGKPVMEVRICTELRFARPTTQVVE